eukprot:GHVR01123499.1.p1 GENE.GHVR01123499.1~~GHVR01123499.1.p1  ORF type:complete len:307 (-),score=8.47 GHVR01123499.1:181-1101(-)
MKKINNPLDKKLPTNPKYATVQPKVNAHNPKIITVSDKVVAKRRDEVFKRIRPQHLKSLLEQNDVLTESIYDITSEIDNALFNDRKPGANLVSTEVLPPTKESLIRLTKGIDSLRITHTSDSRPQTGQSRVSGVSDTARSVVCYGKDDKGLVSEMQLLLLDLREPEDFKKGHILGAVNYPALLLSRDKFTPELIMCKQNSKEKFLVLYHTDDKSGAYSAMIFVQKGWENVYLLSGGIEEVAFSCSDLISGECPVTTRPKTGTSVCTQSSKLSYRVAPSKVGRCSAASSVKASNLGSVLHPAPSVRK